MRTQFGYSIGSNVVGVTALPVMRPVLIIARGVDKSVEVFFSPLALRYVTRVTGPHHTRSYSGRGCALFDSCSVHTAYRSAPSWVLSSRVHALVLHEVITARKSLATFTYESCKKINRTKTQRAAPYQFVVQCKKEERRTRMSPGG